MKLERQIEELAKIEGFTHTHLVNWHKGRERYAICERPDYPHDFNALHRIINGMDFPIGLVYWNKLQIICERDSTDIWAVSELQMKEMILKAYGKWEKEWI